MIRNSLAPLLALALAVALVPCVVAWHTPVHQMITRTAWESLPESEQSLWKEEAARLIQEYCLYPDTYHNAPAPKRAAMRPYCETAAGQMIHNVTWQRPVDAASLEYVLTGMVQAVRGNDMAAAARYAGVLAHFLEDSTCPAHALSPADGSLEFVRDMLAPPPEKRSLRLHTVIEASSPAVDLAHRAPQILGATPAAVAEALLDRLYPEIRTNRSHLIAVGKAAYANDEAAMDPYRQSAAAAGAGLLADALHSALAMAR